MRTPELRRFLDILLRHWVFYVTAALVALALKVHYSMAGGEELTWILAPTSGLVELLTGIHFEKESYTGFINRDRGIIIAPSCAGVNFLIVAFCALYFSFVHRLKGAAAKLGWLCANLMSAYFLAVAVNGVRIASAVFLYDADIYGGWATPERIHRIAGTAIYFISLILVFRIGDKVAERLTRGGEHNTGKAFGLTRLAQFLPFLWYALITLGIPVLNRGYRKNWPVFLDHCVMVIGVCSIIFLFFSLIVIGYRGMRFTARRLRRGRRASEANGWENAR